MLLITWGIDRSHQWDKGQNYLEILKSRALCTALYQLFLRKRNNTIDNVVKGFLKIGNRSGNCDKVESADLDAQSGAGGQDPAQILVPRLRPRVEKGGRNVKHFCGHLEHSVPARAAHDHAERVRQDGGKFVEELLVHGADHYVTAGNDRGPVDHLRAKLE